MSENLIPGDLHIESAIKNNTQDWSAMQADEGKPAILIPATDKKTNCDTVFVGTGGTSLAPGFQMRGYTAGTKTKPKSNFSMWNVKAIVASSGAKLPSNIAMLPELMIFMFHQYQSMKRWYWILIRLPKICNIRLQHRWQV